METNISAKALNPWFVTGFCEKAGLFTFSRTGIKGANLYFLMRFSKKNEDMASKFLDFFLAGKIYSSKNYFFYRATNMPDIETIITHFDKYNLQSKKNKIYKNWKKLFYLKKKNFRRKRWPIDDLKQFNDLMKTLVV